MKRNHSVSGGEREQRRVPLLYIPLLALAVALVLLVGGLVLLWKGP